MTPLTIEFYGKARACSTARGRQHAWAGGFTLCGKNFPAPLTKFRTDHQRVNFCGACRMAIEGKHFSQGRKSKAGGLGSGSPARLALTRLAHRTLTTRQREVYAARTTAVGV